VRRGDAELRLTVERREPARFELNFEGAELRTVAEQISAYSCLSFALPGELAATPLAMHTGPVTAEGAYRAFEAALHRAGLALREEGRFVKIERLPTRQTNIEKLR
jgi:hypothetical protein